MDRVAKRRTLLPRIGASILAAGALASNLGAAPQEQQYALEISRAVRPWEFLCVVGKRAGVFGNESGRVETWVYPLKLLRDFSLTFHVDGREIRAESLARTITVRPESTTILYAGDTFKVRETFFVPVEETGAIIRLDVETENVLEIEASFRRDFQLEWPAALGATYSSWNSDLHAFSLGEERKQFAGLVGSPTGVVAAQEFESNYSSSYVNALRLGGTAKGNETKIIVIAGSVNGPGEAEKTYRKLTSAYGELEKASAKYYADYLGRTVSLELPDGRLQQAYDWARISTVQGVVANPYLGTGLIAGYRTSGESQRPGFAWFFGRDSLWTTFALNSEGDFVTTRDALNFLIKFQREDGKIPHEIAQTASLVNWFKDYPYGFASADATPLFIIATEDYVRTSGDLAFAEEHWDNLWKAYEFLRSTYDDTGFPRNFGVGHGWIEGGPLLPVKAELYQSGLGIEALSALAELAKKTGREAQAKALTEEFAKEKSRLNEVFWSPDKKIYAFALDPSGTRVDLATVLATVPMWFGLLDGDKSKAMIDRLAALDFATDWGTRLISNHSSLYSGGGYHFGSVWPLFTGWAAVGEYRYHQGHPALQNLRANALLALGGSPGHVTEVLSGDYYQSLSTSSPHQIWSAAMVVSPLLRGLLGLRTDTATQTIVLAPSLPASWSTFAIKNLQVGRAKADVTFRRTADEMVLEIHRSGSGDLAMEFRPGLSLRAEVVGAELNGRPIPFRVETNDSDQHVMTRFSAYGGPTILHIRVRHDFGISYSSELPLLGQASEGLRILSEAWSNTYDRLSLNLEGLAGKIYELSVFNGQEVVDAEGGKLVKTPEAPDKVVVVLTGDKAGALVHGVLNLRFRSRLAENVSPHQGKGP
jgi:glycogen debranching enzyme